MRSFPGVGLTVLLGFASAVARADGPAFSMIHAEPPAAVGGRIRSSLRDEAYRVALPGTTVVTLWLLGSCRAPAQPGGWGTGGGARVNFGVFAPGWLLGSLQLSGLWTDSRGQRVDPGLYTLRYVIQPIFKDHTGVSPFRDFGLLAPAQHDESGLGESQDDAIAHGRAAVGGGHPLVMSLLPVSASDRRPALVVNAAGQWVLEADVCGVALGLVVSGETPQVSQ